MSGRRKKEIQTGIGSLTLVEHALCPLDSRRSSCGNLVHNTSFPYSDSEGNRRKGRVQVFCPLGLTPKDEFVLWGLLAITVANPQAQGELLATRHFCLRKLGLVNAKSRRGGRQYRDFAESIERISTVRYLNDSFYDPIRAEHRKVGFGFFSYSAPLDDESSRAWRITWDPIFFEMINAAGGRLHFDLNVYRELDAASRRIYLFLAKLFHRRPTSPRLDLNAFADDVVGIAKSVKLRDKKAKLKRCFRKLKEVGVIHRGRMWRTSTGRVMVTLSRGAVFDRPTPLLEIESPQFEQLIKLGFDNRAANRLLNRYPSRLVSEWIDITMAALERSGANWFSNCPAAYLTDNLKSAVDGKRTAPDWWLDIRKSEQLAAAERDRKRRGANTENSLPTRAADLVSDIQLQLTKHSNPSA